MPESASFIAGWLTSLDAAEEESVRGQWEHYRDALLAWGEKLIRDCPAGTIEVESVVGSVFASLVRGVNEGRLNSVEDHDSLWWLLLAMTRRKVADRVRQRTAKKRGGGVTPISLNASEKASRTFHELTAESPSPAYLAAMQDEFEFLMAQLRDAQQQRIAVLRMEGHTSKEIAEAVGVSKPTIDRKLRLIRETWEREMER